MITCTDLPIAGLKLVQLKIFNDDRGNFVEWYDEPLFQKLGITARLHRDYCSRSKPGVIRGLHYQNNPTQGKLVGVLRGRIWDVAVDLRANSPTYGQHFGTELSDTNGKLIWIPPGFAHGFCALGNEDASLIYKVDSGYFPAGEGGIRFDDPTLNIQWPSQGGSAIVSEKDRALPTFEQYQKAPIFK